MDIGTSVILITSAGTVLGSTLAHHFSAQGATVIVTDSDKFALEQTINRCKDNPDNLILYPLADSSFESVNSLFRKVESDLGISIDVIVNYWPSQPFPSLISHTNQQELSNTISTLATPFFSIGQAGAEHMRSKQTNGVIINVVTYDHDQNKAGIENTSSMISGFTKSWAKELDPFNIRVGGVIPSISISSKEEANIEHWAQLQDELIRSTEYIVSNEYFNGRVMAA
ncbi:short-chain dehydrogenase [Vibrio sp. MACH09]|uniref:SDR family oxidoreductase n=1 Tax=unclassified Vibrio TaxID=2614977 RepID=UPI001493CF82|nr:MULTISPECIES: SDR family oxidoreductase [unclassified Vibrio]NOI65667.1 SDR family oxidoreductase [Vibrio sp. 99-8-1]GLO61440.1 short-chain dehydrogenase [Vibrio sp. MACH09]